MRLRVRAKQKTKREFPKSYTVISGRQVQRHFGKAGHVFRTASPIARTGCEAGVSTFLERTGIHPHKHYQNTDNQASDDALLVHSAVQKHHRALKGQLSSSADGTPLSKSAAHRLIICLSVPLALSIELSARYRVSRVFSICSLCPRRLLRMPAPRSSVSNATLCDSSSRRCPSANLSTPPSSRCRCACVRPPFPASSSDGDASSSRYRPPLSNSSRSLDASSDFCKAQSMVGMPDWCCFQ